MNDHRLAVPSLWVLDGGLEHDRPQYRILRAKLSLVEDFDVLTVSWSQPYSNHISIPLAERPPTEVFKRARGA